MTDERLAEILATADASSPGGPFRVTRDDGEHHGYRTARVHNGIGQLLATMHAGLFPGRLGDSATLANAVLFASGANWLRELVAEVKRLGAENATLQRVFGDLVLDDDVLRLAYERGQRDLGWVEVNSGRLGGGGGLQEGQDGP